MHWRTLIWITGVRANRLLTIAIKEKWVLTDIVPRYLAQNEQIIAGGVNGKAWERTLAYLRIRSMRVNTAQGHIRGKRDFGA